MDDQPFDMGPGPEDFPLPRGDEELIAAVDDHCEAFLGPCDIVHHEIVSEFIHLDVHRFSPSAGRDYQSHVTSGMAEKPMAMMEGVPDAEEFRYAELMVHLPSDWPSDNTNLMQSEHWWPLRELKTFARLPHQFETWVALGHTMAADPPVRFASDTELCASILWPSFLMPQEFWVLSMPDGRNIRIYTLSFLYREELEFKNKHGFDALIRKFDDAGFDERDLLVLNHRRKNVCLPKRWFFGR